MEGMHTSECVLAVTDIRRSHAGGRLAFQEFMIVPS
jgi:enolase